MALVGQCIVDGNNLRVSTVSVVLELSNAPTEQARPSLLLAKSASAQMVRYATTLL